ncbi:MAG: hypothetical protein V3V15_03635 [Sphingorhabdus sp.]
MLIVFLMMLAGDLESARDDLDIAEHEWKSCVKRNATIHALDKGSAQSIADAAVASCKSVGDRYEAALTAWLLLADKTYNGDAKAAQKDVRMTRNGGGHFRRDEALAIVKVERAKPPADVAFEQFNRASKGWESCYRVYAGTHIGDSGNAEAIADGAATSCKGKGDIFETKYLAWLRLRDQVKYPLTLSTAEKQATSYRRNTGSLNCDEALKLVNKYRED